ncbi:MAG TPA: hypothetical protein VGM91_20870 [Conexibacter sp.]
MARDGRDGANGAEGATGPAGPSGPAGPASARNARVAVVLPHVLSMRSGGRLRRTATLKIAAIGAHTTKTIPLHLIAGRDAKAGIVHLRLQVVVGGHTVTRTVALRIA